MQVKGNGMLRILAVLTATVVMALAQAPQITAVNGASLLSWIQNGRLTSGYNSGGTQKIVGRFCVDVNPLSSPAGLYMELVGSNFGSGAGTVSFSDPNVTLRSGTLSWAATKIRFTPQYSMACPTGPIDNFRVTIRRTDGQTASAACAVVQSVQTRPLWQCTWWVATSRLGKGKSIPQPRAYNWTTLTDKNYRPLANDVLLWYTTSSPNVNYGKHTAFVESATRSVTKPSPPKFRITYAVRLSQYNADLKEALSYYDAQFIIDSTPGSPPTVTVVQGVKFSGNSGAALAAWR